MINKRISVSVRSCLLLVLGISWIPHIRGFLLQAGTPHDKHHVDCRHDAVYNELVQMKQHDSCVTTNHMFTLLTAIHEEGCVEIVVSSFSATFNSQSSGQCTCPGHYNLVRYPNGDHLQHQYDYCRHSHSYMKVYNQYFEHHGGPTTSKCTSHHSLWQDLNAVMRENRECFVDLLNHLSVAFRNVQDQCSCHITPAVTQAVAPHQHTSPCYAYPGYANLMTISNTGGCYSSNSVWHNLNTLSDLCRNEILHYMAGKYNGGISKNCHCATRYPYADTHVHGLDHDCKDHAHGSSFKTISEQLFHQHIYGCRDHSYLWSRLLHVTDYEHTGTSYCLKNIIRSAADAFSSDQSDPCSCHPVSTPAPQTTTSTTTSTTTPTTTTTTQATTTETTRLPVATATSPGRRTTVQLFTAAPTSTTSSGQTDVRMKVTCQNTRPHTGYVCDKTKTITDIAAAVHIYDSQASSCNHAQNDESLVLGVCNVTSPNSWKKGVNVLADCQSGSPSIPEYVPIATFTSDTYVSTGAKSAVFIKCNANGFQVASQNCGEAPMVVDISAGMNAYYTIV